MRLNVCFAILSTVLTLLVSCRTVPPKWDGKLWAGDHLRSSVRRVQENEEILANDPQFSSGLWMTYADFQSFYETFVLGCARWRDGTERMTLEELIERWNELQRMQREKSI